MRTETNPGAPDPRNTPLTVGMVGLGLIGGSLARAASRAGFRLLGCDLNETVTLKARLLGIIEDASLSVEYMYSFLRASSHGTAHMILRLNDGAKAAQVFTLKDVVMLSQDDVDAM